MVLEEQSFAAAGEGRAGYPTWTSYRIREAKTGKASSKAHEEISAGKESSTAAAKAGAGTKRAGCSSRISTRTLKESRTDVTLSLELEAFGLVDGVCTFLDLVPPCIDRSFYTLTLAVTRWELVAFGGIITGNRKCGKG